MPTDTAQIFTDGSTFPNPGPSGWGWVSLCPDTQRILAVGSGFAPLSTNNRQELHALLSALRFITKWRMPATLWSDSQYSVGAITKWSRHNALRNWQDVPNADLIRPASELFHDLRGVSIRWLRGHKQNLGNELADTIAGISRSEQRLVSLEEMSTGRIRVRVPRVLANKLLTADTSTRYSGRR